MKTVIVAQIRVAADRLDAAREAIAEVVAGSRAEAGCVSYAFAEDVVDPGLFRISEIWADRAALDAHFKTAHFAAWGAVAATLGITDRAVRIFTVSNEETL